MPSSPTKKNKIMELKKMKSSKRIIIPCIIKPCCFDNFDTCFFFLYSFDKQDIAC